MASYVLIARTNFEHQPPFNYVMVKCRAGYSVESMWKYAPTCPEMGHLMLIIPGMKFEKSDASPTTLDMVFHNRRDLILFQLATEGHYEKRR